ncbi:MAG: superoxide dismutase family protein [Pseudomonadota bacterium]|nr:superoxide dismutase family protein [Pseudomonadota bacterium]
MKGDDSARRFARKVAAKRTGWRAVLLLVPVLWLSGCGTVDRASSFFFGSGSGEHSRVPGLEATLSAIGGSAVTGSVRFVPRGDGVAMLVQINGLAPGRFRVLVHASGNCTSPNGFSAGAPWSPLSATTPLYDRVPIVATGTDGTGTLTVRLSGVAMDGPNGLSGRSVVVHDTANGPFTAEPGVPNNRIACGVIGPLHLLF